MGSEGQRRALAFSRAAGRGCRERRLRSSGRGRTLPALHPRQPPEEMPTWPRALEGHPRWTNPARHIRRVGAGLQPGPAPDSRAREAGAGLPPRKVPFPDPVAIAAGLVKSRDALARDLSYGARIAGAVGAQLEAEGRGRGRPGGDCACAACH